MLGLRPGTEDAGGDGSDAGYSLVELMVTMLVAGVVLALVGTFFVNVTRLTGYAGRDRIAAGQAGVALDELRSVVRVAVGNPTPNSAADPASIAAATPTSFTVYAYAYTSAQSAAATPSRITYSLSADPADATVGYLTASTQAGTSAGNGAWTFSTTATTRRVAGPFVMAASPPIFQYVGTQSSTPMSAAGGLGPADRKNIAYVVVTTTSPSQGPTAGARNAVVTTWIGMPNVKQDVDPSITPMPLPTPTRTPDPTLPSAAPSATAPAGGAPTASATPVPSSSGTTSPAPVASASTSVGPAPAPTRGLG